MPMLVVDRAAIRSLLPRPSDLVDLLVEFETYRRAAAEWNAQAAGKRYWGAHRATAKFQNAAEQAIDATQRILPLISFRCRRVAGWDNSGEIERELELLRSIENPADWLEKMPGGRDGKFPRLRHLWLQWSEGAIYWLLYDVRRVFGIQPPSGLPKLKRHERFCVDGVRPLVAAITDWAEADSAAELPQWCDRRGVQWSKWEPRSN